MADITFSGNIGNSELRFTPNGKAVLSLSVAENHRKRDQSGTWQDDGTTWWRITVWERQAETLHETVGKGDRVLVTGQVRSREFEHDGQQRTSYDVNARHVAVIPKRGKSAPPAPGGQAGDPWATGNSAPAGDEPPF